MRYKLLLLSLSLAFVNISWSQVAQNIDTGLLDKFFTAHPEYVQFRESADTLYNKHNGYFWFESDRVSEFAVLIYKAACHMDEEGLPADVPYKLQLDKIFQQSSLRRDSQSDILITCLYFYYTNKVFGGLSTASSISTGWNLPRNRQNHLEWLGSINEDRNHGNLGMPKLFNQYYELRAGLQKYRKIESNGGWPIIIATDKLMLKSNDTSGLLPAVKHRLYIEGYRPAGTDDNIFDDSLLEAVKSYQEHHGMLVTGIINTALITSLNVPVQERIETIAVNMERCRWINPEPESSYLAVNIPSFHLFYFRNGQAIFTSNVVVGKVMNKTVVFSGMLSQVIFNPYWNVPNSILNKEILPALKKNPKLLSSQGMEWHQGKLRQKPGKNNALGQVKFIFPNSNNIYLHDTPQKKLFKEEKRAFSHGCIRVEKACELASLLMYDNYGWTELQTAEAMKPGNEKAYGLKIKIPVYITYFTAWSDKSGNVSFFTDIYDRDKKLAAMLFPAK